MVILVKYGSQIRMYKTRYFTVCLNIAFRGTILDFPVHQNWEMALNPGCRAIIPGNENTVVPRKSRYWDQAFSAMAHFWKGGFRTFRVNYGYFHSGKGGFLPGSFLTILLKIDCFAEFPTWAPFSAINYCTFNLPEDPPWSKSREKWEK